MTKIGIVGCGNISDIYLQSPQKFPVVEIISCTDLMLERAQAKAEQYGIRACTVDEFFADSEVEIVLNLTTPDAHADVDLTALNGGKSVYSEKPLALNVADGRALLDLAASSGLRIGCAPDTFLGGGLQTCRKLIDDGWIGQPIAATAFLTNHGHESWHPDPEFYYKPGGGPMFDMGPYYFTALVSMLGPVARVTGSTRITFPERTITSQPHYGETIDVEVPTHIVGVVDFHSGVVGNIITTFDVWSAQLPRIEIYGSEGTLSVPDPNTFGGPVRIRRADSSDWHDIPLIHRYSENSRGLGVADMAHAMRSGRPHRANGEMAFHVLEIMEAIHTASDQGRHVNLTSTCDRPSAIPLGLMQGVLDE